MSYEGRSRWMAGPRKSADDRGVLCAIEENLRFAGAPVLLRRGPYDLTCQSLSAPLCVRLT